MAKKKKTRPAKRHAKAAARKAPVRKKRAPAKRGATAGGASGQVRDAIALLRWTHEFLGRMTADFPAEKLTFQSAATDNHVLWTLGHLATSYAWFAALLDGKPMPMPESYQSLFGYKSAPQADPSVYPPLEDLRASHDAAFARLLEAAASVKETEAHSPVFGESYGFAKDRVDVIHKAIWHEGWHQGQISTLRRALGLPGVM